MLVKPDRSRTFRYDIPKLSCSRRNYCKRKYQISNRVNKTERINNLSNFLAGVRNYRINTYNVQKGNTHLVGRVGIQSVPQLATAKICSASSFCLLDWTERSEYCQGFYSKTIASFKPTWMCAVTVGF